MKTKFWASWQSVWIPIFVGFFQEAQLFFCAEADKQNRKSHGSLLLYAEIDTFI